MILSTKEEGREEKGEGRKWGRGEKRKEEGSKKRRGRERKQKEVGGGKGLRGEKEVGEMLDRFWGEADSLGLGGGWPIERLSAKSDWHSEPAPRYSRWRNAAFFAVLGPPYRQHYVPGYPVPSLS